MAALQGGLLDWGPWRVCKGRLWKRAALFVWATLGNLEGARLPGTLRDGRRRVLEMERLSMAALLGEPRGRAPLLGNPKDI